MANNSAERPRVMHHVFFWLKDPASTEDRDRLIRGLKTLAGIPQIIELYIGLPAATEQRGVVDASWQVSELMFFEDLPSQAAYQEHPIHLQFIHEHSHLWDKVVVYDTVNGYSRVR